VAILKVDEEALEEKYGWSTTFKSERSLKN
jgi:hypothetical protein